MTDLQYRVRVQRFGMPDQFHNKANVGKAIKMVLEWEADRTGRHLHSLNGSAELTIESRQVSDWADVTITELGEGTVLLGQGDGP